ncbi:MAG: hypothetical protein LBL41_04400 [Bifidobacteriaceae bacterium]|jgi:hypothetical protein|nr:hypothetical protein [Bifidobacteriaceae bacterium]
MGEVRNSASEVDVETDLIIPDYINYSALGVEYRRGLESLPRDLREEVGMHLAASTYFLPSNPYLAFEHAKVAAKMASRNTIAREIFGISAYRIGDFHLALRELLTAHRISGGYDYIHIIADCERALGAPDRAVDLLNSKVMQHLDDDDRIEFVLVKAGALSDLGDYKGALLEISRELRHTGLSQSQRINLAYGRAYVYECAGMESEAKEAREKLGNYVREIEETLVYDVFVIDVEDEYDYEQQAKLNSEKKGRGTGKKGNFKNDRRDEKENATETRNSGKKIGDKKPYKRDGSARKFDKPRGKRDSSKTRVKKKYKTSASNAKRGKADKDGR